MRRPLAAPLLPCSAREMTLDPVDVIFSSVQPIGYTKEVTVSAKLRDGKIASDNVFYLNVLKDGTRIDTTGSQYDDMVVRLEPLPINFNSVTNIFFWSQNIQINYDWQI